MTTGVNLQVSNYVYLSQAPPTARTVTLTSSNLAVATVSTGSTTAGAASTTFPNTVNTSGLTFYVQGQSVGASTITASCPRLPEQHDHRHGVDPSGFIIATGNFSTTTFSPTTAVTLESVYLTPGTLAVAGGAALNPGIGSISILVASSATQVGIVTSPVTFNPNTLTQNSTFQPPRRLYRPRSHLLPSRLSILHPGYSAIHHRHGHRAWPPTPAVIVMTTGGVNLQVSNYVSPQSKPAVAL